MYKLSISIFLVGWFYKMIILSWKKCHATDLLYTHLTKKRESNGKERNQSSQIQY